MNREQARKVLWLQNYQRRAWLDLARKKLDVVVLKAYGWPGACLMRRS